MIWCIGSSTGIPRRSKIRFIPDAIDHLFRFLLGMHRVRETRARSFPVIKIFNEVSNLLGTSGEHPGIPSPSLSGVLFASPDVQVNC
jgi:hypothetical protein